MSYNIENIEIGIFSFNLGNFYKKEEYQNKDKLIQDFSKIFDKSNNKIWIISTQEDIQDSIFCNVITEYFTRTEQTVGGYIFTKFFQKKKKSQTKSINSSEELQYTNQYTLLSHEKAGVDLNLILKKIQYIVHLMIFVPTTMKKLDIIKIISTEKIKHFKSTKNSVITTFQIFKDNDINNSPVIINAIGSHLPIKTSESEILGYDKRVHSINTTLNLLYNNIILPIKEQINNASYHIIWTGDLNFRIINYQNKKTDQLTYYLSTLKSSGNKSMPIKLKDFTGIENFGPTCKTVADPIFKDSCISKYEAPNPNITTGCYDVITKDIKDNTSYEKSCKSQYDGINPLTQDCLQKFKLSKQQLNANKSLIRHPSYCDRILGWSSGDYELIPYIINNEPAVMPVLNTNLFKVSDHNPIIGLFHFVGKINNERNSSTRKSSTRKLSTRKSSTRKSSTRKSSTRKSSMTRKSSHRNNEIWV